MKQTAVQWLLDKMFKHENLVKGDGWFYVKPEIIEQAKAMEKEQILRSYGNGLTGGICYATDTLDTSHRLMNPEEYYNQTYNA